MSGDSQRPWHLQNQSIHVLRCQNFQRILRKRGNGKGIEGVTVTTTGIIVNIFIYIGSLLDLLLLIIAEDFMSIYRKIVIIVNDRTLNTYGSYF